MTSVSQSWNLLNAGNSYSDGVELWFPEDA